MAFPTITKNGNGNAQAAFVSACASAGLDVGGLQMESQLALAIANIIAAGDSTGSQTLNRVTKTADYTITTSDYAVDVDTTAGAVTITLPATPANGAQYVITKITTDANVLTIGRNGKNLQGSAANVTTTSGSRPSYTWQYDSTSGGWWLR